MSCPTGLLSFQFGPMFARFLQQNPAVALHLDSTNRRVDAIAEGFDIAIRVRFPPLEESDLVMRRLDESTQCLVAHPRLGAQALSAPVELTPFPSIGPGPAQRQHAWELHHADGRTASVLYKPRLVSDDFAVLRDGALEGLGVVQLPTILIEDDCCQGRLVRVIPNWRPRSGIIHAVFPSRRGQLPSVRALLDFLARECGAQRYGRVSST